MRRITIIITLLALIVMSAEARRPRNYTYIIDCTRSMIKPEIDAWEPAKKFLKRELDKMQDEDKFCVIPFRDNPMDGVRGDKSTYSWRKVEKCLDDIMTVNNRHSTGICNAWDKGMSNLNRGDYDNYTILLTDGGEELMSGKSQAVASRLQQWDESKKSDQAFYVMLTEKAEEIKSALGDQKPENLHFISATGEIPEFASLLPMNALNSYQLMGEGLKLAVRFSEDWDCKLKGISCNDNCVKVELKDNNVENGRATLAVSSKYPTIEELNAALGDGEHEILVTFEPAESGRVITNALRLKVINRPEPVLSAAAFSEDCPDLGVSSYYDSFLFWSGTEPNNLTFSFVPQWSPEAQRAGSSATFTLKDSEGRNDFVVLMNGEKLANGTFTLTGENTAPVELEICFNKNAQQGRRLLALQAVSCADLSRIGDTSPAESFQFMLEAKFTKCWNPLQKILLWLGILLLAGLLVWFLLLKNMFYSRFKRVSRFTITDPYYSSRKIHGARRLVLTNRQRKQSALNRLFTGKIIYEVNSMWASDVVIEPTSAGEAKMKSNRDYMLEPPGVMRKQAEYELTLTSTGDKAKIAVS